MKMQAAATLITVAASTSYADPIATFRTLCVNNVGNPAAIEQAGSNAGFGMTPLGNDSYMGSRNSTDEALQINAFTQHAFECAVTTSDVADPSTLRDSFFQTLGLSHKNGQARGTVDGRTYTFLHDTNGGEAFVVFAN